MTIASNGINYEVIIGVTSTPFFGNAFVLDDTTQGVLDNTIYKLGGTVFVDVTNDTESVSITRGRSRQLERFNAGTATIQIKDLNRTFDPTNEASPYFQGLSPRQPVLIKADSQFLFTGIIADFDYKYENRSASNDIGTLTVSAVDQFDYLGRTYIEQITPSAQDSGARITTVLGYSEVSYPDNVNIAAGYSNLGAYQIDANTSAIDYLQQIANTEKGYLFVAGDGTLTFKGRHDVISVSSSATFADTGNYPLYDSIEAVFGGEQLYNRAVITRTGGTAQEATDLTSVNAFGLSTYVDDQNLFSNDSQAADMANYIVTAFGQPDLRFASITVGVRGSNSNDKKVLELDVADTITIIKNYSTGTPTSRTETVAIEGISHEFTRDRHTVSLNLGKIDGRAFLRLDDTNYGKLDENLLAF